MNPTLLENPAVRLVILWVIVIAIECALWKAIEWNEQNASEDDSMDEDTERDWMKIAMGGIFFMALVVSALIVTDPRHGNVPPASSPNTTFLG